MSIETHRGIDGTVIAGLEVVPATPDQIARWEAEMEQAEERRREEAQEIQDGLRHQHPLGY